MLSYTNVVARKAKKTYDSTIGRIVKLSSRARARTRIHARTRTHAYTRAHVLNDTKGYCCKTDKHYKTGCNYYNKIVIITTGL